MHFWIIHNKWGFLLGVLIISVSLLLSIWANIWFNWGVLFSVIKVVRLRTWYLTGCIYNLHSNSILLYFIRNISLRTTSYHHFRAMRLKVVIVHPIQLLNLYLTLRCFSTNLSRVSICVNLLSIAWVSSMMPNSIGLNSLVRFFKVIFEFCSWMRRVMLMILLSSYSWGFRCHYSALRFLLSWRVVL